MTKTAKELRGDFKRISLHDNTYAITPEQLDAYEDQLCKEQREICASKYAELKSDHGLKNFRAIRNAPKPETK